MQIKTRENKQAPTQQPHNTPTQVMTNTPTPADQVLPPSLASLRDEAMKSHKNTWHSVRLELETITPVYGGGTTAGEPDLLLPFRPRAVKNSLCHWWWLLNRHKPEYKDSVNLYKDMTAIWGGASDKDGESQRAKVRVRVVVEPIDDDKVMPYMPYRITKHKDTQQLKLQTTVEAPHFYALWMLKPKDAKLQDLHTKLQSIKDSPGHACTTTGKKFADKLAKIQGLFVNKDMPVRSIVLPGIDWSVSFDMAKSLTQEQKTQVRDSLHAWLMLGGIGARTTRGLGRSILKDRQTETKAFQSLSDQWNPSLTWFPQAFGDRYALRSDHKSEPMKSWEASLNLYKNFRQARQEDKYQRRMKQSYGHLANSLRKLTGKEGHPLPPTLKASRGYPIPEVMFGAPINYQFITKAGNKPEPADGKIHLSKDSTIFDRYTSPLLVTCVRDGEKAFSPVSLCFQHHVSDISDKDLNIKHTQEQTVPAGKWWPDLSTTDGQNEALDWLSEEYRNVPLPDSDELYEELMDAVYRDDSPTNGDPLIACLNFFREHPITSRS